MRTEILLSIAIITTTWISYSLTGMLIPDMTLERFLLETVSFIGIIIGAIVFFMVLTFDPDPKVPV
jgi:hypothetical protein